jgi:hypothetical protein
MQVKSCVYSADTANGADVIAKVVDRVLNQIFGRKATRLIYKHLERNYSVGRDEIAEKLDLFAKGLEDFMNSGADVVERRILEDLQSSCGLSVESGPSLKDFADQVRLLASKT